MKVSYKIPGGKKIWNSLYNNRDRSHSKTVFGLKFRNPVGLAAGFDKNAEFFNEFSSFGFSFIEVGTVTPEKQPGNDKPRLFRLPTDKAVINRMGFNNKGVSTMIDNLRNRNTDIILGANIGKNTATPIDKAINDYLYCFENVYDHVDYVVVNVSCPNIGNLTELQDKSLLLNILNSLISERSKKSIKKPVLLKVSPDLNNQQLDEIIEIFNTTGIDGIVATNTTTSREGLKSSGEKIKKIGAGGLSGRPLNKRSTKIIKYLHEKSGGKIPIIGAGGIIDPDDAIEKLNAGASLIQLYTGFIYHGPTLAKDIINKLD